MRSGNPALGDKTFQRPRVGTDAMSIDGTVNKTGLLLVMVIAAASFSWGQFLENGLNPFLHWGGIIGGFIVAMITIFKKEWAPVTAPLYAVLEGLALGGISALMESIYPGIVFQAILGTFGTLFALLMAYKSGLIKATENFKLGVVAATGGIALIYILSLVLGLFGIQIPLIHESGPIGIGFSVFVCIIAALNLVLDFDFIEDGAKRMAPKYMEWYAAFGLLVTLVWLYLEILRLLAKSRK